MTWAAPPIEIPQIEMPPGYSNQPLGELVPLPCAGYTGVLPGDIYAYEWAVEGVRRVAVYGQWSIGARPCKIFHRTPDLFYLTYWIPPGGGGLWANYPIIMIADVLGHQYEHDDPRTIAELPGVFQGGWGGAMFSGTQFSGVLSVSEINALPGEWQDDYCWEYMIQMYAREYARIVPCRRGRIFPPLPPPIAGGGGSGGGGASESIDNEQGVQASLLVSLFGGREKI